VKVGTIGRALEFLTPSQRTLAAEPKPPRAASPTADRSSEASRRAGSGTASGPPIG
jgi:hypothetical protein